jgi:FeS assembly SUF system protein
MTTQLTMEQKQPPRIPLELEKSAHPGTGRGIPNGPVETADPPTADQVPGAVDPQDLEEKIIAALKTCFDPEIPVNIYELGLIYGIDINPSGEVEIRMTLTSPACPAALTLPPDVQAKVSKVWGVKSANVEVVWEPPWTQDRMSEAAKLQLGLF